MKNYLNIFKKVKIGWLITTTLLLLVFVFIFSFSNKEKILVQKTVEATASSVVNYKDIVYVNIPENLLKNEEEVVIKSVSSIPERAIEGTRLISAYDISIGEIHEFDKEITIDIKYDNKISKEDALSGNFLASFWNPSKNSWINLPIEVDTENNKITYKTKHFSISIVEWVSWDIFTTPNFKILYDKKSILADKDIDDEAWKKKTSLKDSDFPHRHTPYYIQSMGDYLEKAYYVYSDPEKGFKKISDESHIVVKVDSLYAKIGASSYDKIWERLHILTAENFHPEKLKLTTAHELFHRVQHEYYNIAQMAIPWRKWWLESSAEYASWGIVWKDDNSVKPFIGNDFLRTSIASTDDKHEYYTSHFLDFLVKNGIDFKGLWENIAISEWSDVGDALKPFTRYINSQGLSEDLLYYSFAEKFVFDEHGPVPSNNNLLLPAGMVGLKHARGKDDTASKDIRLKIPKNYTSFLVEVRLEEREKDQDKRTLELNIDNYNRSVGFSGRIYFSKDGTRVGSSLVSSYGILPGKSEVVNLDFDNKSVAYILMTNVSNYDIEVSLTIKESEVMKIISVGPQYAIFGKKITINGTGFGKKNIDSEVYFDQNHKVKATDILLWTNNKIELNVPVFSLVKNPTEVFVRNIDKKEVARYPLSISNDPISAIKKSLCVSVSASASIEKTTGDAGIVNFNFPCLSSAFKWEGNKFTYNYRNNSRVLFSEGNLSPDGTTIEKIVFSEEMEKIYKYSVAFSSIPIKSVVDGGKTVYEITGETAKDSFSVNEYRRYDASPFDFKSIKWSDSIPPIITIRFSK